MLMLITQCSNLHCLLKLLIITDGIRIRIKLILKAWSIKLMNIRFCFLDMLNPRFRHRVPFCYFSYLNRVLLLSRRRFLLPIPRLLPVSRTDIHRVMFISEIILSRCFYGTFIGYAALKVLYALHRGEILGID